MPDGRLCCVYYNGVAGGHVTRTDQRPGGGAIAYVTSSDEGRTWSTPAILLDTPEDDRDPNINVLRDGRVMLSYFRLKTVPKVAGDGVYICEIDGNMKAGVPRKLQHDAGTGGPLRDFGGGLLMLGSYHFDQPYVIRSGDNGRTWQVFAIPNGGKHLDAETDVIQIERTPQGQPLNQGASRTETIGSGNADRIPGSASLFYAVMRGAKCNGHYSTSTDGKNWTVAKDIGFPLHCPELHRVELGADHKDRDKAMGKPLGAPPKAPGSIILLTHRVPATAIHYSFDECRTWHGPITVDTVGGAYPGFVTLKDGSVLIVYYEEGKNSNIRCRRFAITKEGVQWQK